MEQGQLQTSLLPLLLVKLSVQATTRQVTMSGLYLLWALHEHLRLQRQTPMERRQPLRHLLQ